MNRFLIRALRLSFAPVLAGMVIVLVAMHWTCESSAIRPRNWFEPGLCGDGAVSSAFDVFLQFGVLPAGLLISGLAIPLACFWHRLSVWTAVAGAFAAFGVVTVATVIHSATFGSGGDWLHGFWHTLSEVAPLLMGLYAAAVGLAALRAFFRVSLET